MLTVLTRLCCATHYTNLTLSSDGFLKMSKSTPIYTCGFKLNWLHLQEVPDRKRKSLNWNSKNTGNASLGNEDKKSSLNMTKLYVN